MEVGGFTPPSEIIMFLRYIDFIFAPFRAINNKILGVKNIKGNIQVDINRAKAMSRRGQQFVGDANAKVGKVAGVQQQAAGPQVFGQQGAQFMQPQQGMPQQQMPGMPPSMPMASPQIRTTGF